MKHRPVLIIFFLVFLGCVSCKTTHGLLPGEEAISELNPAGESDVRSQVEESPKKPAPKTINP